MKIYFTKTPMFLLFSIRFFFHALCVTTKMEHPPYYIFFYAYLKANVGRNILRPNKYITTLGFFESYGTNKSRKLICEVKKNDQITKEKT